ncbi:MAG: hypothetical protein AAGA11_02455 [Pseudomonadota bacterium]
MQPSHLLAARCVGLLFAALAHLASASPTPPPDQQAALQALYTATSGADWVDADGWSASETIACDATGITCDANGNVLEIFLVDNGLNGPLPSSLPALRTLRGLVLNRNSLTGTVPTQWADFETLQLLSLRDNALEGALPTGLAEVESLKVLDLCHNHFSGEVPLAYYGMPALNTLALCHNRLSGTLPAGLRTGELVDLDLSHNQLSGTLPVTLFDAPSLWRLHLAGNGFTGALPQPSAADPAVVDIDLSDNALSGELEDTWARFANLTFLRLARNRFEGAVPTALGHLDTLRRLDLAGNRLVGTLPAALAAHPVLLAATRSGDPSIALDWNAVALDGVDPDWVDAIGIDRTRLVRPVSGVRVVETADGGWQVSWQPAPLSGNLTGHYRVETALGDTVAETASLDAARATVPASAAVDPAGLRVVTVVPTHALNPNTVLSAGARPGDSTTARWAPPETVNHPANFGPYDRADWTQRPAGTTLRVASVATPALFHVPPHIDADGRLQFTPSGTPGRSRVTVDALDANGRYQASFDIVIGPAANRAPSFVAGPDLTVLQSGQMQVVEWASALDDGDGGTQSMRFVIDTEQADWFAFAPDLSVPSGTFRFRVNAGRTGEITLRIRLRDDGGTDNGGSDESAEHTLRITVTEDASAVAGSGLSSDGTVGSGGGALGLLTLWWATGLVAARRSVVRRHLVPGRLRGGAARRQLLA